MNFHPAAVRVGALCAKWRGWSSGRSAELVGVAQPIVRCGEVGCMGRGQVFQRRVRSPDIVVGDPVCDLGAGVIQIEELGLVEQFIAHLAIKTLGEPFCIGFSRRDKCQSTTTVSLLQARMALQVNSMPCQTR